ncbi:MAG: alpha/beta hydrolase [Haloechinothrix sp.]
MTEAADSRPSAHPLRLTRRRALLAAGVTGATLAGAGAVAVTGLGPEHEPLRRTLGAAAAPARIGLRKVERMYSAARGREVELVTLLPERDPPDGLPMSLLLHGLNGSARNASWPSLRQVLYADTLQESITPFGFVAVDGDNNYWHEVHPGDDPMAMLIEEVPMWLRERGLGGPDGVPFAATGLSMGGFGALLYARRRAERRVPLSVAAIIGPALMTQWEVMRTRNVYESRRAWAADDPLKNIAALRDVRIGVWCGIEDGFIEGVRGFIRQANPELAYIGPGGHRDIFNEDVATDVVRFIGTRVSDATEESG